MIKERRIYTRESMKGGMDKIVYTPMDRNVRENNIYINNITHTTEDENSKIKYANRVYMTEDEYQNLLTELGKNKTIKCIEQLDIYKKSKGVEYVDDYATIKRWVIDRVEEIEKIEKKQVKENTKGILTKDKMSKIYDLINEKIISIVDNIGNS